MKNWLFRYINDQISFKSMPSVTKRKWSNTIEKSHEFHLMWKMIVVVHPVDFIQHLDLNIQENAAIKF
jgi:hypothetical protein